MLPQSLQEAWRAHQRRVPISHAVGLKVTSEILTEHLPDGGLLMSVTTERFDPTDAKHLRRARIVAEIMIERTGYRRGRRMYA